VRQADRPNQRKADTYLQRRALNRNTENIWYRASLKIYCLTRIQSVSLLPKSMEGAPPAAEFKHKPLPDSTTYIRLLEIRNIDANDHVVCLLTTWPVEKAPEYYALSYVLRVHTGHAHHANRSLMVSATPGAHPLQVDKSSSMAASSRQVEIAFTRSSKRIHQRRASTSGWMLFESIKALHKRKIIRLG
jgi:hypothetical protein